SRFVEDNNIEVFKSAFREKYEGEEKPLAEVLDTERGIGYPVGGNANMSTPLIESIGSNFKDTMKIDWTAQEILLFSMAQEAMHSKSMEIDLAKYEKDILKLEANPFPSPASMSAIFKVVEDQNGQARIHFKGAFGPSATTLIGRFADGHQPIQTIVNDIAKHEEVFYQQQQIELAEIAHLPESRTGNILFRPAFRKYEIPYLAGSTLEKDCQLDISDLMVSIKNDEVVIRSKKLNKRVLPRLGNAHNYEFRSLPIYQFLGDLQFQSINNGFYFEWGILKTEFTYLPRVTYQGVILARAQWNFSEREIKKLRANPAATLQAWKEQYQLPDLLVLLEGDNELLINVNDPLSVEILLMESKKSDFVTLLEFLFSTDNPLLKDQNGSTYTNEFIAFLLKKQSGETAPDFPQPQASQISICRTFPPGTEWVYFKLYCGYKTSDKVIAEYLLPFAEKMKAEEKIDKWFFIRYNDPRPHLRFRVLAKDRQLIGDIICRFYELLEPLSSHSVIHDIQLGTYTRELERYGGNLIELAESIFHADSKCIANFINLIEGDEGEKYRWFFALLSIDQLLEDFGIGLEDKLRLSESLKKGFAEEFKVNKNIKDQINDKYRTHRQEITQLFQPGSELREEMMPAIDLLEERGEEMAKYIAIYQQNKDQFDYRELLDSYIHMICNRLFISNQRKHELVIYDFLFKIYMSLKMRSLSK
ncbi:MAG: lantibiotic dehydratase, partial [Bacteroidota bacterium]